MDHILYNDNEMILSQNENLGLWKYMFFEVAYITRWIALYCVYMT